MSFYADLHIHSKFSRATSRDCDLEHLAYWARRKGITILATGDFTHPGWFAELKEKLVPAEPGLFRLRDDLQTEVDRQTAGLPATPVRFILEVEISTIYKRAGRTRKVHHLIYAPSLEAASEATRRLEKVGNLASDGRPILGLDSRDLLEIALASGEGTFLVPAHIWTPWFAVLGSQSGFEDIEECYGELSPEIFAVETGLSSDPPMNWRLSRLDRFTLISNSDTHSPGKIGREACVFDTALDYFALRRALATGEGYGGTVEFYPEEGKYHLDGHRKCDVCFTPAQTQAHAGLCPVCGKPVTVGVMHRVHQLADRAEGQTPAGRAPFRSFVPLAEIIAEVRGTGAESKAVQGVYENLLARLGPELEILGRVPVDEIRAAESPLLAEAIDRMRQGRPLCQAGYDGEYGVIRFLKEEDRDRLAGVNRLFALPAAESAKFESAPPETKGAAKAARSTQNPAAKTSPAVEPAANLPPSLSLPVTPPSVSGAAEELDPEQQAAAEHRAGPLLIIAGPGTGKTRTLTHRLARLIRNHGVKPESCLAITFTRRAAGEMRERLARLLPAEAERVPVLTFHALGLNILREQASRLNLPPDFGLIDEERQRQMLQELLPPRAGVRLKDVLRRQRETLEVTDDETGRVLAAYEQSLLSQEMVDFTSLIRWPLRLLESDPALAAEYRQRYAWISVDEYQDLDALQYRLLKCLVAADGNLCAIGDPDQAIYGFRGADVGFFQRFTEDFPSARVVQLTRNYRSGRTIVDASLQAIRPASLVADRRLVAMNDYEERIVIQECGTDRAEAETVVQTIERLIGGSTFFSLDSGRAEAHAGGGLSFADFGVLYRTEAQADCLDEAFRRSGLPFQRRSHDRLADRPAVRALVEFLKQNPAPGNLADRLAAAVEKTAETERESALRAAEELRPLAVRHGADEAAFLAELALGADVDLWDPRADRVSLLTLHAAKGLEFRVVFIVGCEAGLLPLTWGEETDTAEERRLLFVGLTRARERLFLLHARRRLWRGTVADREPSPFLRDLEEQLLERRRARSRQPGPSPAGGQQLQLFS